MSGITALALAYPALELAVQYPLSNRGDTRTTSFIIVDDNPAHPAF
jgi:hypothetical protein